MCGCVCGDVLGGQGTQLLQDAEQRLKLPFNPSWNLGANSPDKARVVQLKADEAEAQQVPLLFPTLPS